MNATLLGAHAFVGRHDRDCDRCNLPDRHEVHRLATLILDADSRTRQPIDLNYVAIPKDAWERIVAEVKP